MATHTTIMNRYLVGLHASKHNTLIIVRISTRHSSTQRASDLASDPVLDWLRAALVRRLYP